MRKFKEGDIVRYSDGSTALMKVTNVPGKEAYCSPFHGPRYYGRQFFGGAVGSYEADMKLATDEEIARYEDEEKNKATTRSWT